MSSGDTGHGFWKDGEIVVDRDGIPHYTGVQPGLMREYRKRVLLAFHNLEGSGDEPEKEAASLKKKQMGFAKRLVDGLHGEAWRACQALVESPAELRATDGYKRRRRSLNDDFREQRVGGHFPHCPAICARSGAYFDAYANAFGGARCL